mmetsp:Transcript_76103/g.215205  ORF Transcript_76103/g.215205 Transcript_76103/m.215205 type:complete len:203 (+) Transcript_76103:1955-2563(+)
MRPSSGTSSSFMSIFWSDWFFARSSIESISGSSAFTPGNSRSFRLHISSISNFAWSSSTPRLRHAVIPRVRALLHSNAAMKCTAEQASTSARLYSPRWSSASARVPRSSQSCSDHSEPPSRTSPRPLGLALVWQSKARSAIMSTTFQWPPFAAFSASWPKYQAPCWQASDQVGKVRTSGTGSRPWNTFQPFAGTARRSVLAP